MNYEQEPKPMSLETPGMTELFLAVMAREIEHAEQYGYPARRLVVEDPDSLIVVMEDGTRRVQLPEYDPETGESYYAKPEQQDEQTTPEQQALWQAQGLELDTRGRPLHPLWREMIQTIGVLLGRGKHRYFADNPTVDMRISKDSPDGEEEVAYGVRVTTDQTCVPGGYVERNENEDFIGVSTDETFGDPWDAAVREVLEEIGLSVPVNIERLLFYFDVIPDGRGTVHAWNRGRAYAIRWPDHLPSGLTAKPDELTSADWTTRARLAELPKPFGLHGFLLFPGSAGVEIPAGLSDRAEKLAISGLTRLIRKR